MRLEAVARVLALSFTALVYAGEQTFDVCDATGNPFTGLARIRGTAQFTPDGLFIGDMACAAYRSGELVLPSSVRLQVSQFATPQLRAKYEKFAKTATRCNFFQLMVEGNLICRKKLSFHFSDRGEPIAADGYGPAGFSQCEVRSARLLIFEALQEGTACALDGYLRK